MSSPALGRILENLEVNDLDEKGRRFLATAKREARRSGAFLSKEERKEFRAIDDELETLQVDFQNSVEDSERASRGTRKKEFVDVKVTELDLDQVGSDVRPPMDDAFAERTFNDVYSITPQNEQVIQRMVELRHKRAQLLGYANFVEFALQSDTPVDPKTFRKELAEASERLGPLIKHEMAVLSETMKSHGEKLKPWNVQVATELLVWQQYPDFDRVAASKVLPPDTVISGIFRFIGDLFSLDFRQVSGAKAWHLSVQVYDVLNTHHDDDPVPPPSPSDNAHLIGRLYLDVVQRPNKCRDLRTFPVFPSVPGSGLLPAVCLMGSLIPQAETSDFDFCNVASLLEESGLSVLFILAKQSQYHSIAFHGGTDVGGLLSQLLRELLGRETVVKRIVKDNEAIMALRPVLEERALGSNMLLRTRILDHIISVSLLSTHEKFTDQYLQLDLLENVDIDGHFLGTTRELVSRLHHLYGIEVTQTQHSFTNLSDNNCRYYTDVRNSLFAKQMAQKFLDTPTEDWSFLGYEFRKAVLDPQLSEDTNELLRNFFKAKPGKVIKNKSWLKR